MSASLVEKELEQQGNLLIMKFDVLNNWCINNYNSNNYNRNYDTNNQNGTYISRKFLIGGSSLFQVKVMCRQNYNPVICVKFQKRRPDNLTYKNNFSSVAIKIEDKSFVSDEGTWHIINEKSSQGFTLDIAIRLDIVPSVSSFAALHGDTELTDFELRGQDGSVQMHRAVLAASSPVFKTMLGGAWKETKEGCVEVPGTSVATLNHFKDYIYRHTMPESGVEPLLELAAYYSMPELEQICVYKLMEDLTGQNVIHLLDLACKHRIMKLFVALFESVKDNVLKVEEVRNHLLREESM